MGIRDLNKFLDTNTQTARRTIKLDKLKGCRVAIDATLMVYRLMSRSNTGSVSAFSIRMDPKASADEQKRDAEWFRHVMSDGITFASFGIVPIFVFDGTAVPAKAKTQQKRKDAKKKDVAKMKELEEELSNVSISERSDEKIEELRRLKGSAVYVPREQIDVLKDILSSLGFPVISAKGEAEKTCASLAIEGKVAAVFSQDTDCVALKAPLTLSNFTKGGYQNRTMDAVVYDRVLEDLKLTEDEFTDLCILGKCDFNENLPGYGIKNAWKLYKKLPEGVPKKIENILPLIEDKITEEDIKNLDYEYCRSEIIFGYVPSHLTLDPSHGEVLPSLEIDKTVFYNEDLLDKLESVGIKDMYHMVKAAFQNINSKEDHGGGAERVLGGRVLSRNPKVRFVLQDSKKSGDSSRKEEKEEIVVKSSNPADLLIKHTHRKIQVFE